MDPIEQVIADAAADIGGGDDAGTVDTSTTSGTTEPATEAPAGGTPAATTDAAPPAPTVDEDDFDQVKERNDSGQFNRIPHPRVKRMIEKKVAAAIEARNAERDAEIRKTFGLEDGAALDFTPIAERYQKASQYEQQVQAMAAVEKMMVEQPEVFLRNLMEQVPAYKDFVKFAEAQAQQQAAAPAGFPEPDVDLGNGQRTYSVQGLQQRLEWERNEAVRLAEERFAKRFEPFEQQQRVARLQQDGQRKVQALREEALKLPQFAENEAAIVEKMRSYPNLAPEAALYRAHAEVMAQKMATMDADIRKKIAEEMKSKPASTASPTTAATQQAPGVLKEAEDPLEAIIRKAAGL